LAANFENNLGTISGSIPRHIDLVQNLANIIALSVCAVAAGMAKKSKNRHLLLYTGWHMDHVVYERIDEKQKD